MPVDRTRAARTAARPETAPSPTHAPRGSFQPASPGHGPDLATDAEARARFGHDFSAVRIHAAPPAIARFDPAYNDVKDDFWNTKAMFGNKWGNVADSAMSTIWDAVGMTEVGGIASTGIDLLKSGYSEGMSTLYGWNADITGSTADRMRAKQYDEASGSFLGDAGVDAVGLIPGLGTLQGGLSIGWDGARTIDLATGGDPNALPSAGEGQKKLAGAAWDRVFPEKPAPAPDPAAGPDPDQPPPYLPADPFQGM